MAGHANSQIPKFGLPAVESAASGSSLVISFRDITSDQRSSTEIGVPGFGTGESQNPDRELGAATIHFDKNRLKKVIAREQNNQQPGPCYWRRT